MSPAALLFFLFLFLLILSPTAAPQRISAAVDGGIFSPYDLLQNYNLPVGLLPKGVTGYDLDPSTGHFRAYMKGTCSFSPEGSYQLRYGSTIGGTISQGRIKNLSGVSVKVVFLWFDIVEVVRSGDEIQFSVGFASAGFPIGNFNECPQCAGSARVYEKIVSKFSTETAKRALWSQQFRFFF